VLGRRRALVLLATLPALLTAGCSGSESAASPGSSLPSQVTVGLLTPKTGVNSATGTEAIRGADLAIDVVNNQYADVTLPLGPSGGLASGVKLVLAVGDTQSAPERVEEQSAKLVRESGAIGLVLSDELSVARPAGREIDILGVAMIDAASSADLFADLNRSGHFRIQPTDKVAVRTAIGLLYQQRALNKPLSKLTVLGPAGLPGANEEADAIRGTVADQAQSDGFGIGRALTYGPDPNELAAAVSGDGSNAVVAIVTSAAEAATAVDLATRLKGRVPVLAVGPAVGLLDTPKAAQSSLLRTTSWSAEYTKRNPVAFRISQLYEKKFGVPITQTAAASFMATLTLAVAIDTAKGLKVNDVRSSVQQLDLPATQTVMPWEGIRFDGNGNNQLGSAVIEQRTAAGYQVVYPVELSSAPLTWP
jgi:branched-chain amino acid transport system substrate-binding protein